MTRTEGDGRIATCDLMDAFVITIKEEVTTDEKQMTQTEIILGIRLLIQQIIVVNLMPLYHQV